MTKVFPMGGRSAAFLNGACVVMGGRPGKVSRVDATVFAVEFPEQWLMVLDDGSAVEVTADRWAAEALGHGSPPPVEPEETEAPAA